MKLSSAIFFSIVFFAGSVYSAEKELKIDLKKDESTNLISESISPEEKEKAIDLPSSLLIQATYKTSGQVLSYDEKSVLRISEMLTKERETYDERTKKIFKNLAGAFFGNALIIKNGGSWVKIGDNYAVKIDEKNTIFPFDVTYNYLLNGGEETLFKIYSAPLKN